MKDIVVLPTVLIAIYILVQHGVFQRILEEPVLCSRLSIISVIVHFFDDGEACVNTSYF